MGKAYKNFWSLNVDEAIAAGILRDQRKDDVEVFMPLNAQMKGIDLVLMDTKTKKAATIQVKGSRAYEPSKSEVEKYGDGSPGWFMFSVDVINKAVADYFVFLVYVLERVEKAGRREIVPHTITIATSKLKHLASTNKKPNGSNQHCFFFWVNPKEKKAFDYRNTIFDVSDCLDRKGVAAIVLS